MTDAELIDWLRKEVDELKADRREWDAERRYLVDSVMALTGATRLVQRPDPEATVEEVPIQAGPHRKSWNQIGVELEQESARRRQEHLKALASLSPGGAKGATQ